jgi:hypothetical protein
MENIFEYLTNPYVAAAAGIIAQWIFSAFVSSMPEPNGSGRNYLWAYRFLHTLAANMDKLRATRGAVCQHKEEVK